MAYYSFQESQDRGILGVSYDASDEEIRIAYKALVKKYNPDSCKENIKKFTEFTTAYKNLLKKNYPDGSEYRAEKKVENYIPQNNSYSDYKNESREWLYGALRFGLFLIISPPILVIFWNIHPVLGLLGLAIFLWLARNKWKTEYYFGE